MKKDSALRVGESLLPAGKLKILTINEDRINWISLKKFGLKKVPVNVYGVFEGSLSSIVGYRFSILGYNLPITSLVYKNEKINLQNMDSAELKNNILIYENNSDSDYSLAIPNDVVDYAKEHVEAMQAIKNCYNQASDTLMKTKKMYKIKATKAMKK